MAVRRPPPVAANLLIMGCQSGRHLEEKCIRLCSASGKPGQPEEGFQYDGLLPPHPQMGTEFEELFIAPLAERGPHGVVLWSPAEGDEFVFIVFVKCALLITTQCSIDSMRHLHWGGS